MLRFSLKNKAALVLIAAAFFALPGSVRAEKHYVTDMLYITLRAGKGTGEKVATLRSDTPVEVLEDSGSFLKVRTEEGRQGWVPGQYLTPKLPKAFRIAHLEQELDQLKKAAADMENQSSRISELEALNAKLQLENEQLRLDLDKLRQKSAGPRPPAMFWWFLAGGIVFFAGALAGTFSKKRKFYIDALK